MKPVIIILIIVSIIIAALSMGGIIKTIVTSSKKISKPNPKRANIYEKPTKDLLLDYNSWK
jgi:flagellar basal body-associated protein FliL